MQTALARDLDAIAASSKVWRQAAEGAQSPAHISGDIQSLASGAEQSATSVAEISAQVVQASEMSGRAVGQAQATQAIISGLNDSAEQIGAVVALIQTIAAQTNLLALKATTAKATEQIAVQITGTQTATERAVAAVGSIRATIVGLNRVAATLDTAVEEQSAVTQAISMTMQTAAQGVGAISSGLGLIAESAGQADAATQALRSAAQSLA